MRKFLIASAILGLIGGTSLAMAQDHGHGGNPSGGAPHGAPGGAPHGSGGAPHGPGGAPHPGGPAPHAASPAAAQRSAPQAAPNAATGRNAIGQREFREHHDAPSPTRTVTPAAPPAATPNAMRGGNNFSRDRNDNRNDNNGRNTSRDNNAMRGNSGPAPNFNRPNSNGPNNAMRGNGPRRDFSSARNYHQNFRATRRFHAPAYRQPSGYYARRWAWGMTLPTAFWARDYWLTDFNEYDLPPPPFGAVWVRVGDDALLIDQDSGEIIEVDYGVFY
jgi:Ni/Co efflux regulator RcnB